MPLVTGLLLTFLTVDPEAALRLAIGLLYYNLTVSLPAQGSTQGPCGSTLRNLAEATHICIPGNRHLVCGSRNNSGTWLHLCMTEVLKVIPSTWGPSRDHIHPHPVNSPPSHVSIHRPSSSYMTSLQPHSTVTTEALPAEGLYLYIKRGLLFQMNRHQCRLHGL